ncbi:MAG: hypothetical protein HBSAPP03_12580 [Phycisphaerae bacterium]|nr:MAG: hypothetical protein HBSAPP03_12580 [Phycisphaerae bacterium]
MSPARPFAPWAASWKATAVLVLGVLAVRLVYLAFACRYTLIEDEAHYWEWSRRLALSYYTKGPGIAWVIAACTHLLGDSVFAIRLTAPISSAIGAWFTASLAGEIAEDRRAGFVAAACWTLAPMFQALGLIITIDGPYSACWAMAAWATWRAVGRGQSWAWVVVGAALGIGTLFKYTMLLFIPALVVLWIRSRPAHKGVVRGAAARLAPLMGLLAFAACLLPIAVWNQREGWPTVRHLLGHLGVAGGDVTPTQGVNGWHYSPLWTLSFLGTLAASLGPILVLAVMGGLASWRGRRANAARWSRDGFLIVPAAFMLGFYFIVSFIAEPEGNWALAGQISLFSLAAGYVVRGMDAWREKLGAWRALPSPRPKAGFFVRRPETPVQMLWYATVALGVAVALAIPDLSLVQRTPLVGRFVPVHRFTGADAIAARIARLMDDLRAREQGEPFVITTHYGRASQMAYYLPGRPVVFNAGSLMGTRKTQYDYWPDTNLRSPAVMEALHGRSAVALGGTRKDWLRAFARVEPVASLGVNIKKSPPTYLCSGYRGFAAKPTNDAPATNP